MTLSDFDLQSLKIFPNRWVMFCDLCGVTVWLYAILKLFVFDIDAALLVQLGPSWSWIADFRLVVFLATIAVIALAAGRARFIGLCLYVIAFPVIFVGWKVSFLVIRSGSWVLGISFLNWFISIFSDLIYKLAVTALYAVSVALIVFNDHSTAVTLGIAGLSFAVIATFARMAINSFRAPRVLTLYRKFFGYLAKGRDDLKVEDAGPRGIAHFNAR